LDEVSSIAAAEIKEDLSRMLYCMEKIMNNEHEYQWQEDQDYDIRICGKDYLKLSHHTSGSVLLPRK
jgi:hypothetical protein